MGRRENPVDPDQGPVAQFAYALREVRQEAGAPTYRAMARKAGYSVTALSRAAAGEKLPSLAVALAYVEACGGDRAEWEERWRTAQQEVDARAHVPQEETVEAPYRGLVRFEAGDRDLFFGRDRLTDDLVRLARAHRVTAVFGPSGSGKSSLLRAGLIPCLREAEDAAPRPAAIRILTPGTRPAREHAGLFTPAAPTAPVAPTAPTAPTGETWLIVDQFEETFTLCHDPAERQKFLDLLLSARADSSRLRVVLGVRADFYARCLEHEGLAAVIREASLPVGPMTPSELREAIVRPATAAGLIVERSLTDRLIEEVGEEPGGLPLLSHALLETWRRRRGRTLSLQAYEAVGGIHGAIAQTAEAFYTRLTADQAETARRILLRLITPGHGTPDTRRPVDRTELDSTGPAGSEVSALLHTLARARLITLDETTVDLAHEALITAWPRLDRWIDDARGRLRRHRRLTQAARHWQDRERDSATLLRGTELTETEDIFRTAEQQGELTALERDFLHACTTARARARRLRHAVSGVVALLVSLALVAGAVAWQQSRTSERHHQEAVARRLAAVADSMRASDPVTAMRLSTAASTLSGSVETRAALLGALSQREQDVYDIPGVEPMGLTYLSGDGRVVVVAGERVVRAWSATEHRPAGPPLPLHGETAVTVGPDGHRLLATSGDRVRLWNLRTGKPMGAPFGSAGSVYSFGPGGRMVLGEGDTGGITLWDTERRRVSFDQRGSAAAPWAISPDDRLLALCSGRQGAVQVWDVAAHRKRPDPWPRAHRRAACEEESSLQFSPDGRGLLSRTAHGLRVWDMDERRERTRIRHKGLREAALSPDGRFVVATDGREILLWRTEDSKTPVFRVPLTDETATELRVDVRAGVIRYLSELGSTDVAVRTLSYGAAMSGEWSRTPAAQGAFSANGRALALERRDKDIARLEVRRVPDGKLLSRTPAVRCEERPLFSGDTCHIALTLSPDGSALASTRVTLDADGTPGEPGPVTLWDMRKGSRSRVLNTPSASRKAAPVAGLAFTPGGGSLLIRRWDGKPTETWDVAKAVRAKPTAVDRPAHNSGTSQGEGNTPTTGGSSGRSPLAIRPDGLLLAAPGQSSVLPSGRTAANGLPAEETTALAFSPDGKRLAAGGNNGRVVLWDGTVKQTFGALAGTYDVVRARPGPKDAEAVTALAYSPDGTTLAVGGEHGTLQLWDAASRRPLGSSLPTPGDAVLALAFSTDGRTLHAAGRHSALRSLAVDTEQVTASVCARAHGGLSRSDWQKYIPEVPYRDVCAGR
ncbi:nSTAND1 domain-containing NTPase [Streptomyces venezuelae]|uniref:nSTAND1 domain-containing NTPase n=1 Tax=Streptomyces venezuelae TaxID=54571 RepID=UPI003419DB4E